MKGAGVDAGAHHSRLPSSDVAAFRRRSEAVIHTPADHPPAKVDTTVKPRYEFISCTKCRGSGRAAGKPKGHREGCLCGVCRATCTLCRGSKGTRREVDPVARQAARTRGVEVADEDRRW